MALPTTAQIRAAVKTELLGVTGLGGNLASASRRIFEWSFEVDDVEEAKKFWESNDGAPASPAVAINGIMLKGVEMRDLETLDGKEFVKVWDIKALFRYGKRDDPKSEARFCELLDAIHDKIRGNANIFKTQDGRHPQPHADQVCRSKSENKKLFGMRVWEAEIEFSVVGWVDV